MDDATLARELVRSLDEDFPNHNSREKTYEISRFEESYAGGEIDSNISFS